MDEFFLNVIVPGDSLLVVTPLKTYDLKDDAFTILPKDKVAELLNKKVREDVIKGNAYYKPQNYVMDGNFKKIKVLVKDQKYRVIHRSGYIAD